MNSQVHLRSLTTMRIIAALWVVLFHYWPLLQPEPLPRFIEKGYLGVELFFVLSGFIICHVYLERFGTKSFSYVSFIWARLARIYPLHLAILVGLIGLIGAASVVGVSAGDHLAVWSSVPAELLMLQAWGLAPGGGWNHPSWSISAEWFAYLTFPVTAALAWPQRNRPWVAVAGSVAIVWLANWIFPLFGDGLLTRATVAWGALRIVPCFLLGSAVYLAWRLRPIQQRHVAEVVTLVVTVLAVLCAVFQAPDALTVTIFGAVVFSLACLSASHSRWLTSKVGVYLGEVSFAVYMVCIPYELLFTEAARRLLHLGPGLLPWPLWILLFAGVIPAAMALHHAVERPARDLMRRWEAGGFALGARRHLQHSAPSS